MFLLPLFFILERSLPSVLLLLLNVTDVLEESRSICSRHQVGLSL